MCGIAGLIGEVSPQNRGALQRMADAIAHRGPDASGFWEAEPDSRGWAPMLAHRRLSILDLSPSGAQPMHDPKTGHTIVFNGEIYNYQQLRSDLSSRGEEVWSTGDTAVLLRTLGTLGTGAIPSLRGMFAFAYWNTHRRQLVLSRDVLGIKPLYVYQNPSANGTWSLAFSSEIRSLLASGLIESPRLNPDAVASVVWNGFTMAPSTSVEGVDSLWPGETRIYDTNGLNVSTQRDWPLPEAGQDTEIDEEELAHDLEECVRLHLASDVPLGVFLSGGIDSSVIANLAFRTSVQPVRTFTLAFEEKERNEGVFSREIAKAIGTDHQELVLTQSSFVGRLDAALDSLDQPSFDGLNSYFMSHAVRDAGVKVALVGSGGDELFGGYTSFRDLPSLSRWGRRFRFLPRGFKAGVAQVAASFLQKGGAFPPQTRWAKLPDMVRCEDDLISLYQLAYAIFRPSFQRELLAFSSPVTANFGMPAALRGELLRETKGRSALETISILEQRLFLGERLLRDTDAVSMSASIEIRTPLVDSHLLRQVNRIRSPEKRYHPLRSKALLRRIGLRGLDPALFDRPKSGFELPYDQWMRGSLGETIDKTFRDPRAVESVGLRQDAVLRLWEAFRAGEPGLYWSRIWGLYVLIRWAQRHSLSL